MIVNGALGATFNMNGGECYYNGQILSSVTISNSGAPFSGATATGEMYFDAYCGRAGYYLTGFSNGSNYYPMAYLSEGENDSIGAQNWSTNTTYTAVWTPAPAGKYQINAICTTNGVEYYCNSVDGIYKSCPKDSYSKGGAAQCTPCPVGKTTNNKTT